MTDKPTEGVSVEDVVRDLGRVASSIRAYDERAQDHDADLAERDARTVEAAAALLRSHAATQAALGKTKHVIDMVKCAAVNTRGEDFNLSSQEWAVFHAAHAALNEVSPTHDCYHDEIGETK